MRQTNTDQSRTELVMEGFRARYERLLSILGWFGFLEQVWNPILAAIFLTLGLLGLAFSGALLLLPDLLRAGLLFVAVGLILFLLFPLMKLSKPDRQQINRRLEEESCLSNRPLSAISDDPALGGSNNSSMALWHAHNARMAFIAQSLRMGWPRVAFFRHDRWALRVIGVVVFVIGVAAGWSDLDGRLKSSFSLASLYSSEPLPGRFDAWIKPPRFLRNPPTILSLQAHDNDGKYMAIAGGSLILQADGPRAQYLKAKLETGGSLTEYIFSKASDIENSLISHEVQLSEDIQATIFEKDQPVVTWTIRVARDAAPEAAFSGVISQDRRDALVLSYDLQDDHGIKSARVIFSESEKEKARSRRWFGDDHVAHPLYELPSLSLSLPNSKNKTGQATSRRDLSLHPFAGSFLDLKIEVTDHADQVGYSLSRTIRLPGRKFDNPLAAAILEQRSILARDVNTRPYVLDLLDSFNDGNNIFLDSGHYLVIDHAKRKLEKAVSDEQFREVVDAFWNLALALEEGTLGSAETALRQAEDALKAAIERGADSQEIARLTKRLREAMRRYMTALARSQNRQLPNEKSGSLTQLSQDDLEKMLQMIEELTKAGQLQEAARLLDRLGEIMRSMQFSQQNGEGQGGQGQQPNAAGKLLDEFGKIIRRQNSLLDETNKLNQRNGENGDRRSNSYKPQSGQGQKQAKDQLGGQRKAEGQNGQNIPNQGDQGKESSSQANGKQGEAQGELLSDFQRLLDDMQEGGLAPDDRMDDASDAMGQARDALNQGRDRDAAKAQSKSLAALREAADELIGDLEQAAAQGGDGANNVNRSFARDPLGRSAAGGDSISGRSIDSEIAVQRVRRILKELQRRLGDFERPKIERDYIERLLEFE